MIQPEEKMMPPHPWETGPMRQPVREPAAEARPEKIPDGTYWYQFPWGELRRVTKSQQRRLMEEWLETAR